MVDKKQRRVLGEYYDSIVLLDSPAFDRSIIGVTHDGRAIYDYSEMIEEFSRDEHCSIEEAEKFIVHKILGRLSSMGDASPIVLFVSVEEND